MALEARDVQLRLKATDLASADFKKVAQSIQSVTDAITTQAAGVAKGETALDELRRSYAELEQSGKRLAEIVGGARTFEKAQSSLASYAAASTAARDKADQFAASLASQSTVSKRAQERLNALNSTAARAEATYLKQVQAVNTLGASLRQLGVDTRNLAGFDQQAEAALNQNIASRNALNTVIAGYSKTVKDANAAERNAEKIAEYRALSSEVDKLTKSYSNLSAVNIQLARAQGRGGTEAAVQNANRPGSAVTDLASIRSAAQAQAQAVQDSLGGPVNNYLALLQDLERSLKSVQGIARQVDGYQAQANAVRAAGQAYAEQARQFKALRDALRANPNAENAAAVRAALPAYNQARQVFAEQSRSLRVLREELKQAGVATRDFGNVQKTLLDVTDKTNKAIKDLNRNFDQFGGSRREGAAGIFGLRPYELQNLSFQINDFFTQLASGASASQAFAQQVGQVAQIQPIWTRIVAFAPLFAALGSAILVTVSALGRLNAASASTRQFAADLSLLSAGGSGSGVTATQLTAIARAVESLGFAFDDARKSATTFLREGIAPANITAATEAAARLSRVLGVDVADATRLVANALTRGSSGFDALTEAGFRFTEGERATIAAARAANDTFREQQTILQILAARFREADEQGLGPWQRAIIAAQNFWRGFLDELGRTAVFQAIERALAAIATGLANIRTAGTIAARALIGVFTPVLALFNGIAAVGQRLGLISNTGRPAAGAAGGAGGAPTGETAVGGNTPEEVRAQGAATRRELEIIRDDNRRSRRERETAALRLARIEVDAASAGASAATRAYLAQLELLRFRQQLDDQAGRGGGAAARRDFQAIQQDLQNTLRIRDETIRGIQEDVRAGALSPAEAIRKIQEAADAARPSLERLATEAESFRGGDAVRQAAQASLVAQARRQAGASGARAGVQGVLQANQQETQRVLQERANLVQSVNALEQQGLITRAEAEERILRGYDATRASLEEQIRLQQEAADAARDTGAISEAAYGAINAQLELYRANLDRINPSLARLRQGIENTFVQSATTAIDSLAKAAGDLVAGVTSVGEAFEAAGQAALQFVADVLKGIAQVIIQEQVLIAVQSIRKALSSGFGGIPVSHAGGIVGSPGLGSGRRRSISPSWAASAPRYHSGGIVGLAPNEQLAILEKNEEVLTKDSPRNILNGGEAARSGQPAPGGGTGLRQVLAIGDQEIAAAMNGAAGEQVFMTWLKRNTPTIRQVLR